MVYPEFTLSYGDDTVTLTNQNIVSWERSMIEPDANDLYKGIPVRVDGNTLLRWSLSLIASDTQTASIKKIYKASTRDRFNKALPGNFEVTLSDLAETKANATHKVIIESLSPKPISCDRYEIKIDWIEMCEFMYIPAFSINDLAFHQSEITSYSSQAVIEEEEANSWEWSLDLTLDSARMTDLTTLYNNYVIAKSTPNATNWGVTVNDAVGAGPDGMKCEITTFSHTVSMRGFEVQITLKTLPVDADAEALSFTIGSTVFAGKEINSAPKRPLVTRGIEIIPTGATVVTDNCGPGVWTWSCDFESTKIKCAEVVDYCYQQRVVQLIEGSNWLVPVVDGVNGGTAMCAIESAEMNFIKDKPGKWSLQVELREVNT